jgi:peroxiredoxin/predicted negative regulator of RcsB-dependent stress response
VIVIIFMILLTLLGPLSIAEAVEIKIGEEVPDFTLNAVEGGLVNLSEHRGQVVVLFYWRADQERSHVTVEDVKAVQEGYGGKGVEIIGIVADTEDMEAVKRVMKEKGAGFPVLKDTGRQIYGSYGIRVYPTTLIIDREGKLNKVIPGHAVTYQQRLEGQIRLVLGEIDDVQLQEALEPKREKKGAAELEAERKYNLALKFTESRLFDQAIEAAQGAVEAAPGVAKGHILLGFLYLEMKEADRAEEEFMKALELEPHSDDAETGLGRTMIMKGQAEKAIEVLTEAAGCNPDPHIAYYELGKAYDLKGEKDMAREMYRKALDKIVKKQILPSACIPCE